MKNYDILRTIKVIKLEKGSHMKKIFWFVLLGTVSSFCGAAASSDEVVLQQDREILDAALLHLQVRNIVVTQGILELSSKITFTSETKNLVMTVPQYGVNPDWVYTFKYLDESRVKELADIIKTLEDIFYEGKRPNQVVKVLCEKAGVPSPDTRNWTIAGARNFLEKCRK
jgi:hypothetical protein